MLSAVDLALIAVLACLAWWGSTGLILSLIARAEHTYRWSMLGVLLVAVGAITVIVATRSIESVESAIASFAAAILVWGAIEMAFLMGYVVGPRRAPCPQGLGPWERFKASWAALAHHEIALAVTMLALFLIVRGNVNMLAFHTFALLWLMRLSTKLNIFLGVSNGGDDFLPPRISYLRTYFASAPMNPLFPLSVTVATGAMVMFAAQALRVDAPPHVAAAAVLLATFTALGLLEHWLLVLPLPTTTFWPWASRTPVAASVSASTLVPVSGTDG